MHEYASRADTFWQEAGRHVLLAWARWSRRWSSACRSVSCAIAARRCAPPILQILNLIQTIPSIALFGILMAPLG